MTAMFIVVTNGSFVFEAAVIWRTKVPWCFRSLKYPSRPISVPYFSNSKAWMNSDIMETVLDRLNSRLSFENCKVILFLECHMSPGRFTEPFN